MFYVYVIESIDHDTLYFGFTTNLKKRLKEHNLGLNVSTKKYKPWRLIYFEGCLNESDARRRERYLKKTQRGRMLKRRLKDYFYERKDI